MIDSEIILAFLNREFLNDHPAIYLYSKGKENNKESAIRQILEITNQVFSPIIENHVISDSVKSFLENKKNLHMKGLIKSKWG